VAAETAIAPGARIPSVYLDIMTPEGPARILTDDVFAGRSVILFGMPGAYTPYCHSLHLPSVLEEYSDFKSSGADIVACTAVNDIHVLTAWGNSLGSGDRIVFLADGNGDFARAIGMLFDGSIFGIGLRSKRYAMWVENGIVREIAVKKDSITAQLVSASMVPQVFCM
jgi:peroxiredoxin